MAKGKQKPSVARAPVTRCVIRRYGEWIVSVDHAALYSGVVWSVDRSKAKRWDSEEDARSEIIRFFHGTIFPSLFVVEAE
jgi:hypothetical protein